MGNTFRKILSFISCKMNWIILAVVWLIGLFVGMYLGSNADNSYFLLMRMALNTRVSIVGLLGISCLPFLLSAYAVYLGKPKLILLVCFCKAVLFTSCGYAVLISFGSAGWLIRLLLQFSDIVLLPLYCWFSIRHIHGKETTLKRDTAVCILAAACAGSIDYCLVSPFLAMLIDV